MSRWLITTAPSDNPREVHTHTATTTEQRDTDARDAYQALATGQATVVHIRPTS